MNDSNTCVHSQVVRCMDPYKRGYIDKWVCESCGSEYGPLTAFAEEIAAIEDQTNQLIDMATGMFSNLLWDLHQRAYASKQVADQPQNKPLDSAICEENGHKRGDDGVCTRCGDSPFLGASPEEGDR